MICCVTHGLTASHVVGFSPFVIASVMCWPVTPMRRRIRMLKSYRMTLDLFVSVIEFGMGLVGGWFPRSDSLRMTIIELHYI